MKNSFRLLVASVAVCFVTAFASAQAFVGSDDFNTGSTAHWDAAYRLNSALQGNLSFTNARLDFTKSAGLGNQFRLWDSDANPAPNVNPLSFTTSWTMTMSATNTLTGLGAAEFASIGMQVFNDDNSYSALMLNISQGGAFVRAEGNGFTTVSVATADVTDVRLQLSWNATAQTLDAAFSVDGIAYTPVATFLPTTQWSGTTTANGFNFGLFGNSNMADAIAVGSVNADNFSVAAIPEPSTYAAMAGALALGLAAWRKRQRHAA